MIGFDGDIAAPFVSAINCARNQRVVLSVVQNKLKDLRVPPWDVHDNNVQCHETNKSFRVLYPGSGTLRTKERPSGDVRAGTVSGDEDEGCVLRGPVAGGYARGVRVWAGPGGGPTPWAPQTHATCVQAACTQRVGEHPARQRAHRGSHHPRRPALQGPCAQLQHRHHIQGRGGHRR